MTTHNADSTLDADLGIGCFNCNGLGNDGKRELVLKWLDGKDDGIFLLQETHSTTENEEAWKKHWDGDIIFNHGSSNSTGVAILIKRSALREVKIIKHVYLEQGRALLLEIKNQGNIFTLINIYCPNNDDADFINKTFLDSISMADQNSCLIFGGDWNTVMDNLLDKHGGARKHSSVKSQSLLNSLIADWGFSDIFRLTHNEKKIFTHVDKQHKTQTRLDFFLVDDRLVNYPVCRSDISHGFRSDHSYVSLKIKGHEIKHGRGYWKLNNSHLRSEEFTREVKNIITATEAGSFDSYGGLWDTIKFRIKDYAIYFGKKTKKAKSIEKEQLEAKISRIQEELPADVNHNLYRELAESQARLDELLKDELQGAITRSKVQWVEEGERSTKYFFGLERTKGKKKMITKLVDEVTGQVMYSQDEISEHTVDFYQSLYNSDRANVTHIDQYIDNCNLATVPEELAEKLREQISLAELDRTVQYLCNNKSPGWDGLSAEFYKHFWSDIKHILYSSFLESIDNQSLSPSQRIGVLTLIPKPKPPPDLVYLRNWRPITLLNVDYKIFSHVVKNRVIDALPHVISQAQTGFQSGKSTLDNLVLMCLVLEHFENNDQEEGLLLQVDFQRAFDSVGHHFLFKVLRAMGFGDYLLKLVKTAFAGCMSFININGNLSSPVYLGKGLHQGSPLSPVLFLLVAQVFTKRLELNHNIHGLAISGIDILLSLYADDTDMFLEASVDCLEAVFIELRLFGDLSGCKANIDKTKCVPLGQARINSSFLQRVNNTFGSDFITHEFSALGIKFSNNISYRDITEKNYVDKISKVAEIINIWKGRDLTLYGRVTVIKSLLMSQFVYLITPLLFPSQNIIKQLNKIMFNFLWGGKTDKVKRETIIQYNEDGGLNMFHPSDFIRSLKLKLLQKITDDNFTHPWKLIVRKQLIFSNYPIISLENNLIKEGSNFLRDIGLCYEEWRHISSKNNGKCIDHCIWKNAAIKDLHTELWNERLIKYGILYLSDFINSDGSVMTYGEFCGAKLGGARHVVSPREFGNIRMAIRGFANPMIPHKNVVNIDLDLRITFFQGTSSGDIKGQKIRNKCIKRSPAAGIPALTLWCHDLNISPDDINWNAVFANLNCTFTNNFKLVQFQFKLLHRITTSRYMRFKMKIDNVSGNCYNCKTVPETLPHIFIDCPISKLFVARVTRLITERIDNTYEDNSNVVFITCNHPNPSINFLWAVAKYYISYNFQHQKDFHWKAFTNYLHRFFVGEKPQVVSTVRGALLPQ